MGCCSSKYIKVLDISGYDEESFHLQCGTEIDSYLSSDSIQLIVDGLSHNTSLETLDISSENVLSLASVLRVNTRLKELILST